MILDRSDHDAWLDPEIPSGALVSRLTSYPSERLQAYAVSTVVNNSRNEKPECVVPVV